MDWKKDACTPDEVFIKLVVSKYPVEQPALKDGLEKLRIKRPPA
jgi:hypothetical protein